MTQRNARRSGDAHRRFANTLSVITKVEPPGVDGGQRGTARGSHRRRPWIEQPQPTTRLPRRGEDLEWPIAGGERAKQA